MTAWRVSFNDQSTAELLSALQRAEEIEKNEVATRGFTEFLVDRFKGLKIEIYANEHPPPHFHISTNNGAASFSIADCELVDGDYFLRRRMREIRAWHAQHKKDLIKCWNATRPSDCPVGEYRE